MCIILILFMLHDANTLSVVPVLDIGGAGMTALCVHSHVVIECIYEKETDLC